MNYGYPSTVYGGFGGAIPAAGFGIAPGGFGKPFGKPYGLPYGKGFGKPFGKPFAPWFGGWPASIGGGFGGIVPATTVATSPYPI